MSCDSRFEQLSAFLDGELTPTKTAELTKHLQTCPSCAQHLAELGSLRSALAQAIPEGTITQEFLTRIENRLDRSAEEAESRVARGGTVLRFVRRQLRPKLGTVGYSMAAAALAATVVFGLMKRPDKEVDLAAVRDAALRTSVVSNDLQNDSAAKVAGFRVAGVRHDILAGHSAVVATYEGAAGAITLCHWAANGEPAHGVEEATYRGVKVLYWNDGTTEFWAADTTSSAGIRPFVTALRGGAI